MTRFYHSRFAFFSLLALFLLGALLFFRPLLPYVPRTLGLARDFLTSSPRDLRSQDGRTNILVLGLGGQKNEPSGLTDTVIFASLRHSGEEALLLSIPRDIWVPQMRAKLNTAYYYGNRSEGLGLEWSRDFVADIVGQPIHYVVVVSYEGFVQMIDFLGGVDIFVERSFVDEKYPIPGKEDDPCGGDPETRCRYETVSFKQGWQHFDGERALKFARSRNAEGEEGTDFARSVRQQKIIVALREKLLSPRFFLNPQRVVGLVGIVSRNVEMDIPESHLGAMAKLASLARNAEVRSFVLNGVYAGLEEPGFLENPPVSEKYDFQWVLAPRGGSWTLTQEWASCLLEGGECLVEEFAPAAGTNGER